MTIASISLVPKLEVNYQNRVTVTFDLGILGCFFLLVF